jgi:hypothetical protein
MGMEVSATFDAAGKLLSIQSLPATETDSQLAKEQAEIALYASEYNAFDVLRWVIFAVAVAVNVWFYGVYEGTQQLDWVNGKLCKVGDGYIVVLGWFMFNMFAFWCFGCAAENGASRFKLHKSGDYYEIPGTRSRIYRNGFVPDR